MRAELPMTAASRSRHRASCLSSDISATSVFVPPERKRIEFSTHISHPFFQSMRRAQNTEEPCEKAPTILTCVAFGSIETSQSENVQFPTRSFA